MKKRIVPILVIVLILQFLCMTGYAQGITVTTGSTPSICYNDGTLTVTASGGTAPYSYTITAGPSNPNITYPIVLPLGQNTFINLPHGTYTIHVTDGSGNTGTFTGTVGGTYQFPTLTLTTSSAPAIIAAASGGLPPYQYAISSAGPNTGFGPYQSSSAFAHICPGQYWVRVRDSCQNIFTDQISYGYSISDTILCANYSKGFFSAEGLGGRPPYTYSFGSMTNHTGVFTGLPAYFFGSLAITDSCGVEVTVNLSTPSIGLFEICPFDSAIHGSGLNSYGTDTLTFICTDCTPPQTVTSAQLSTSVVFQHIVQNQNYHIVVLGSSCGGDTLPNTVTPASTSLFAIGSSPLSCNSFKTTATAPFDSVIVRNAAGVIIAINKTGDFFHLPAGTYTITAYTHPSGVACLSGDSASANITIPFFPQYCESMTMDSSCHAKWQLIVVSNAALSDKFSLVYSPGDTVAGIGNGNYDWYFYHLNPGIYTLISDSGCTEHVTLDSIPVMTSTAVSYLPCVGLPTIDLSFSGGSGNMCSTFFSFSLTLNDTAVSYTPSPSGGLEVTDSGWYMIKWRISSFDAFGNLYYYDQQCPVDSNLIYVSLSHIPTPISATANVCDSNSNAPVHYQIYGGFIPYTVEIPGYDTATLMTNTGTFPTSRPGQYTMIVYDNCGISRSITFSIIDTCNGCPKAVAASIDTFYCAGDIVHLHSNLTTGAVIYQWIINGSLYSIAPDTTFIPATAGQYNITLQAYSISGCEDSTLLNFTAVNPLSVSLGPDTVYCNAFSRILSTGIASTHWSTGQTGPQITINSAGKYWASVSNKCGTYSDTINVISNAILGLNLTASPGSICSNRPDSVILLATVDSLSQPHVTFIWSSGQIDSPVYSSAITAHSAGSYQVTVDEGPCTVFKNTVILSMVCDSTDSTIIIDSTCVHKIAIPDIFTPNGDGKNDSFYVLHTCPVSSFSIHIYNRWGELVFESADIDKGWDGTYRGKQEPEEVYTWFVCVRETNTAVNNCTTGTVTLVR